MLLKGTINVAKRDDWDVVGLCGRKFRRRSQPKFLVTSSTMLRAALKQLYMNMQAQSVCVGVDARLLLVSTTSGARKAFRSCC